ncbi:DUF2927 domain-containing protein [Methanobacterium petrolearium]|nr:DUF2927 domain-containing protein [Methanobacterium petrolearium]MBP1946942.1 hypothetical protein [Methanobacterium petrolearium]
MPYLVCEECGGCYKLQEGESPEDFILKCDCGGKLRVIESWNDWEVSKIHEERDDALEIPNYEGMKKPSRNFLSQNIFKICIIVAVVGILIISVGVFYQNEIYGVGSSNENEKYSQEQIDTFMETAFSPDDYGNKYDRVGKWNINVVRVRIMGSPTQEDINTLKKAVNDINGNVGGLKLVLDDKNEMEPDIEIYFIPHAQFAQYSVNPSEADGFTLWLVSTSGIYGGNSAGEIYKAKVFVGTDNLSQKRRSHVIIHELAHSLGLHHNQNQNSALCPGGPDITEYSDLDKTMMRMLYRKDILPNMSRREVETILNNSRKNFF